MLSLNSRPAVRLAIQPIERSLYSWLRRKSENVELGAKAPEKRRAACCFFETKGPHRRAA
jgi:hypothetical protein